MRKLRQFVELAPLLDVVLILLFAFMLNIQNVDATKSNHIDELEYDIARLSNDLQLTTRELSMTKEALTEQTTKEELRTKAIDELLYAMAKLLNSREDELKRLIDSVSISDSADLANTLDKLSTPEQMVEELIRLSLTSKRFYIIDITLSGSENSININGNRTGINILLDDVLNAERRASKEAQVFDLIQSYMEEREGGSALTLITLSVRDENVYYYAHNFLWNQIRTIQEKYGLERVFRAEYAYY